MSSKPWGDDLERPRNELPERPAPSPGIKEILAQVLKLNGLGGDPKLRRMVSAWREAAGSDDAAHTRVVGWKSGVLTVEVDSAPLLQELSVYRKRELIRALRTSEKSLVDVKFKPATRGTDRS